MAEVWVGEAGGFNGTVEMERTDEDEVSIQIDPADDEQQKIGAYLTCHDAARMATLLREVATAKWGGGE